MQDTMQTSFFARNKTWIIILGVIVIIGLWLMSAYNGFVSQLIFCTDSRLHLRITIGCPIYVLPFHSLHTVY